LKSPSIIILKNGSSFLKKWVFFKKTLKPDSDFLTNQLWSKNYFSLKK